MHLRTLIRTQMGLKQFAEIHKERPCDALPHHPPEYDQRRMETTTQYFYEHLPEDAMKVCRAVKPNTTAATRVLAITWSSSMQ